MFIVSEDNGASSICLPPPTVPENQLPSLAQELELCAEGQVVYSPQDGVDENEPLSHPQDESRQGIENHDALSTQLRQHIDHDIKAIVPQLHGILSNLNNPAHLQLRNSETITEFRSVLGALEDAFAAEFCHSFDPHVQNTLEENSFEGNSFIT